MRKMVMIAAAGAALLAVPATARPAAEISSTLEMQDGDFGTGESVETAVLHTTVRLESGRTFFFASLPYQRVEAPANVVAPGGPLGLPIIIDPTQPATREVREGFGDLRIGAGYRLPRLGGVDSAVVAEVKLPTASARRGLGTGETDIALGLEASRPIGAVTPYVAASYVRTGDPESYRLDDSFALRSGVAAQLSPALRGMVEYGYAHSSSALVPSGQQLASGLDMGLSRRVSLGLRGTAGLSDGAANLGASVRLGWRIF